MQLFTQSQARQCKPIKEERCIPNLAKTAHRSRDTSEKRGRERCIGRSVSRSSEQTSPVQQEKQTRSTISASPRWNRRSWRKGHAPLRKPGRRRLSHEGRTWTFFWFVVHSRARYTTYLFHRFDRWTLHSSCICR
jgi:hypothetical protein